MSNIAHQQYLQHPLFLATYTLLILLVFISFTTQAKIKLTHWQKDSYLIDSFIEIALKREYSKKANSNLARWQQPLRIFIKNEVGNPQLQNKMYHIQAKHLQSITGHPISFVDSHKAANVFVVFTSQNNMQSNADKYTKNRNVKEILKDAACMASISTTKHSEIIRGVILIPVDNAFQNGRLVDCVIEELTQVMGLPNDSTRVFPSVFNDQSTDCYLTGLDYLLLKIAYHPLLHAGMNEKQVRKILPKVLAELRTLGEIDNAQWRVYAKSIRSWLHG